MRQMEKKKGRETENKKAVVRLGRRKEGYLGRSTSQGGVRLIGLT